MRLCAMLTLALLSFLVTPALATTYTVDVNGTGDFTSIYFGVEATSDGDTVLVLPGLYTGELNNNIGSGHSGNFVMLADTSSRLPVIIDGGNTTTCFNLNSGQDAATIIGGFTIQNGHLQGGGGMRITNSSPTIENCTFRDNHASSRGGAIYIGISSSAISNCIFHGNSADDRGGAIYTDMSSVTITGCLFDENVTPTDWTRGGALFLEEGSETVTNCTMVGNTPDNVMVYNGSGVTVSHCIIASATDGVGITASPADGAMLTRSVLFGNAGGDAPACDHDQIIYADPLFCDDEADDFTLCDDSFAVWYNNAWAEQIGAYGSGCEPCGTPVETSSWGRMKALYR